MNLNKELHNDITRLLKEKVCKGSLPNWNKDRKEIVFIATELCNHLAMEAFSCEDPQNKTNTFVLGKLFDLGSLTQCAFDEYLSLAKDEDDCRMNAMQDTYKLVADLSLFDTLHLLPDTGDWRDKVIPEMLAFLEKRGIVIGDEGRLIDTMTVYYAIFLFGAMCAG